MFLQLNLRISPAKPGTLTCSFMQTKIERYAAIRFNHKTVQNCSKMCASKVTSRNIKNISCNLCFKLKKMLRYGKTFADKLGIRARLCTRRKTTGTGKRVFFSSRERERERGGGGGGGVLMSDISLQSTLKSRPGSWLVLVNSFTSENPEQKSRLCLGVLLWLNSFR